MNSVNRRRILELATTAPNVDNAQPFYFQWQGERLLIYRDAERDRQRGNAGDYVSMVGLGCLVECVAIAASGEGLAADAHFSYDPQQPAAPWQVITFRPDSAGSDELLLGLEARCSDRREYQGGDLSDPVFQEVETDAARFRACNLSFREPSDQRLMDYLHHCEAFLWDDRKMLPEMLSWVRWSREEVERTQDGMPWQAVGVGYLTSRLMKLVARSGLFRRLARRSGGPLRAQQDTLETNVRSSAALGCIAVRNTRHETMLQLGRSFLRAWVRLNLAGFGVQVMASPALHAFQHVAGILPDDYPEASKRVFARGAEVLRDAFALPAGQIPAWMFRTGMSAPLPAEMRTLRLPLSRVVRSAPGPGKSRQLERIGTSP